MTNPAQVSRLLQAASDGDPGALDALLPLVYEELRRLARSKMAGLSPGMTLQPTALVHDAYLRLAGGDSRWESRRHFFGAAARAMRNVLVDQARRRERQKRGGGRLPVTFDEAVAGCEASQVDTLALDEALTRLEELDARKGRIVELRYFTGLTLDETAKTLGVSTATVEREWAYAKAWLHRELSRGDTRSDGAR